MNLLAFDTSTETLSVALAAHGQLTQFTLAAGPKASELILPEIDRLLKAAKLQLRDLQGIAYGAGPGAFTGVRVACGVAQGLGFGANLPVVGINTLHAVAEASAEQKVIVGNDARMGEIYFAALQKHGEHWQEVIPTTLCKPDDLPDLTGLGWVAAGNAWAIYGDALQAKYGAVGGDFLRAVHTEVVPSADAILRLAEPLFDSGKGLTASEARPIYVRNRVALTAAQRAAGERL